MNNCFALQLFDFFRGEEGEGERVSVNRYQRDKKGNLLDRFLSRFHR